MENNQSLQFSNSQILQFSNSHDLAQYIIDCYGQYLERSISAFHEKFDEIKESGNLRPLAALSLDIDAFVGSAPSDLLFLVRCCLISPEQYRELYADPTKKLMGELSEFAKEVRRVGGVVG